MVEAFFASSQFAKLSTSSQKGYLLYLGQFADELGDHHPAELKPHGVARLRENLSERPATANRFIKSISALYSWGREMGHVTDNPAKGIKKLKGGEHKPWTEECIAAIPTALRDDLAWPHLVALHTGQRLGDVLRMHRDHVEGNAIRVVQGKTGKELLIPLHPNIAARVKAAAGFVCQRADGRKWEEAHFQSAVAVAYRRPQAAILDAAGAVFHGLRKNATSRLLEAGCSEAETAAITGMSLAMVMHYGKGARQKTLAEKAMRKLELYPGTSDPAATH